MYKEFCPWSTHRLGKRGRYLDLTQYFLVQIEKRVVAVSLLPNEVNNLSVIHSSKKEIRSIDKVPGGLAELRSDSNESSSKFAGVSSWI